MLNGSLAIDTHLHPIAGDFERYPLRPGRRGDRTWSETPMSADLMLLQLDAAQVDGGVLVQSTAVYGFDNSYIADCLQTFPDRCAGMCAIEMTASDAPDVLTHWVRERGMHGLRVTNGLGDPAALPVWQRAQELGIPVVIQLQPDGLAALPDLLSRFPDVKVGLDHAANINRPGRDAADVARWTQQLLDLAVHPNLYLKLTSQNLDGITAHGVEAETYLSPFCQRFGVQRLMWGTDYPATADITYDDRLTQALTMFAFLSEEDRAWLLGRSALALWPHLAAARTATSA